MKIGTRVRDVTFLDAAWGGRDWVPPPEFKTKASSNLPDRLDGIIIGNNAIGNMRRFTCVAQTRGIAPTKAMWARPDGVLFRAMHDKNPREPSFYVRMPLDAIELLPLLPPTGPDPDHNPGHDDHVVTGSNRKTDKIAKAAAGQGTIGSTDKKANGRRAVGKSRFSGWVHTDDSMLGTTPDANMTDSDDDDDDYDNDDDVNDDGDDYDTDSRRDTRKAKGTVSRSMRAITAEMVQAERSLEAVKAQCKLEKARCAEFQDLIQEVKGGLGALAAKRPDDSSAAMYLTIERLIQDGVLAELSDKLAESTRKLPGLEKDLKARQHRLHYLRGFVSRELTRLIRAGGD